jgi:multiple sugar transport system substrate-binding protein
MMRGMWIQLRALGFLPTTLLLFVFAACGGEEGEKTAEAGSAETDIELVTPTGSRLVFWYQHTRTREEAVLELIAEFNSTNPYQIHVDGEYAGDYGAIYNKMMVSLQSGNAPDLVVAYQNQAMAYFEAEGLVDLSPYMSSPKWGLTPAERADYVQAFLEQDNHKGVQICFPPNRSIEILYSNLDWLSELGYDAPPATWDDFAALCRLARDRPFSRAKKGARSLGFLLMADASRLASMVFSRGGELFDETSQTYTLNTPQARASLKLMQELIAEKAVDLVGDSDEDLGEFAVGQVVFIVRTSSSLPYVESAVDEGQLGFAWEVGPLPHAGDAPIVDVYGASIGVGRTTPSRQLASWLFLKWFTAPAQQARWAQASNYFPVRYSTADELEAYFEENPRYQRVFALLPYGKAEPSLPGYQTVRRMMEEVIVDVGQGGDIDRALEQLERRANATIH